MTRPLPDTIHLGAYIYRVSEDPTDWHDAGPDAYDCWGHTDHVRGMILVHPDANPALKRVTLLHEILHACAFAGGVLDKGKRREEQWVSQVAPMMLDVLRSSPGLVQWLTDGQG